MGFLGRPHRISTERSPCAQRVSAHLLSEKFKRVARDLGCDEDEAAFDRALKQMKPQAEKAEKNDLPNDRDEQAG